MANQQGTAEIETYWLVVKTKPQVKVGSQALEDVRTFRATPAREGTEPEDASESGASGKGIAPACSLDDSSQMVVRKEVEKIIIPDLPNSGGPGKRESAISLLEDQVEQKCTW